MALTQTPAGLDAPDTVFAAVPDPVAAAGAASTLQAGSCSFQPRSTVRMRTASSLDPQPRSTVRMRTAGSQDAQHTEAHNNRDIQGKPWAAVAPCQHRGWQAPLRGVNDCDC
jgi:hypothetical protein